MHNQKGMGLLGLLIAVVIAAVLLSLVLQRYAGQTRRSLQGIKAPASARTGASARPAAPCNGRLVGNICVPTEVRSAGLEQFEQLSK